MNWEALGSIAELIGAIGVVTSLFYLAYQVRSNTKVLKADAAKEAYIGWSEFARNIAESRHVVLLDALVKPDSAWSDFSTEEQAALGQLCRSVLIRFESEYSLYESNILSPEVWEKHRIYCKSFISAPAVATWWESELAQSVFSDAFIEHLNSAPYQGPVTIGTILDGD